MSLTTRLTGLCLLYALLVPCTGLTQPAVQASPKSTANSRWNQLSARDRTALAPLAERWGEISEIQRSKWLTIAKGFDQLPAAEQQVMQARMKDWVALSPAQRNQARLNFNHLQSVSRDERKTRWDEYQALSEAEKRKLSAGILSPAKTAAPSPKPVASDRLVQPTLRTVPAAALPSRTPIDKNTLLPLPPAPADSQPSPADAQPVPAVVESAMEASGS